MKKNYLILAKYNGEANRQVFALLDKLSHDEREKERETYYGSLSKLFRHAMMTNVFFARMFRPVLTGKTVALEAATTLENIAVPQGTLSADQWKVLGEALDISDKCLITLISALDDADFSLPVPTKLYKGNPAAVPFSFLLNSLVIHATHHRGQLSQLLDELKIDNNYSGISGIFLG
jgi:uncharacterized damage-inducible protein DinB